jgi:hypothetical protein
MKWLTELKAMPTRKRSLLHVLVECVERSCLNCSMMWHPAAARVGFQTRHRENPFVADACDHGRNVHCASNIRNSISLTIL